MHLDQEIDQMSMSGGSGASVASMNILAGRMNDAEAAMAAETAARAVTDVAVAALQAAQAFVQTAPMTVANLLSNFPASTSYVGKYARVTDLWGSVSGVMRCSYNGRIYWWAATDSEEFAVRQQSAPSTGTMQPLTIPQLIQWTGTGPGLGVTVNVTIGLAGAYPGMVKEFSNQLNTFLGGLNILGTGLGSGLASLLGSSKRIACIDNGSALQWIQL